MKFNCSHGVYEAEKYLTTEFVVDVCMDYPFEWQLKNSDDVNQTLDYSLVYNEVKAIMNVRKNLIETLALEIKEKIHSLDIKIESVHVKISKIHPLLDGYVQSTSVEI